MAQRATRMAQRHLRIGAPVFRPASRPARERNSRRQSLHGAAGNEDGATPPTYRSAGLQTGIAAAGRETPIATFAHSWDPIRGRRDAPWIRIRRPNCAQRHAETGLWEFRPPPGDDAGLKTGAPGAPRGSGLRRGTNFSPAGPPPRDGVRSPCPARQPRGTRPAGQSARPADAREWAGGTGPR